jgi:hypothetical protein
MFCSRHSFFASLVLVLQILLLAAFPPKKVWGSDVEELLRSGKGQDAVAHVLHLASVAAHDDIKKKFVSDALDLCLLIGDAEQFLRVYDTHSPLLGRVFTVEKYADKSLSNEEESLASIESFHEYDRNLYHYLARVIVSSESEQIKEQLSYVKNSYSLSGDNRYPYSVMRAIVNSEGFMQLGDYMNAEMEHMKAVSLLMARDIDTWYDEMLLSAAIANSTSVLSRLEDAEWFFMAIKKASGGDIDFNLVDLNPYAKLRIFLSIHDSVFLTPSELIEIRNEIHSLARGLQLANGDIKLGLAEFYGVLALEEAIGESKLEFSAEKEFIKLGDQSIVTQAFLLLLNLESNRFSSRDVDQSAKLVATISKFAMSSTVARTIRGLETVKFAVEAINARARTDEADEVLALEGFFDGVMLLLGDQNPAIRNGGMFLARSDEYVYRYFLDRLMRIDPSNPRISKFGFTLAEIRNDSLNGPVDIAYKMLAQAESSLEIDQILNRVTVFQRLNKQFESDYIEIIGRLNVSTGNNEKKKNSFWGSGHSKFDEYLAMAWESKAQLLSHSNAYEQGTNGVRSDQIIEHPRENTPYMVSELTGAVLVVEMNSSIGGQVSFRDNQSPDFLLAREILSSQNLRNYSHGEIKNASILFSKTIFGEDYAFADNPIFLSGATILGVPYTLLSDPRSEDWLVEVRFVTAYSSLDHYRWVQKDKRFESTNIGYVAFGNPSFRSVETQQSIEAVENMIRGTRGGVDGLDPLPETETEVMALSQSLSGEKKLFFGDAATVDSLFGIDYQDVEVLSFNTHGVMAGEIDGAVSSAIVLSPTETHDGIVSVDWLLSLKGAPKVVILATCNSGTEEEQLSSSELTSLADVFLLKGAKSVLSSYWQVDSQATVRLLKNLSSRVSVGDRWSVALTKSVREMIESKDFGHPASWAAFTILGDFKREIWEARDSNYTELDLGRGTEINVIHNENGEFINVLRSSQGVTDIFNVQIEELTKDGYKPQLGDAFQVPLKYSKTVEEGVFYAMVLDDGPTVFNLADLTSTPRNCTVNSLKSWVLEDFFVSEKYGFALFTEEDVAEYRGHIVSIGIDDCYVRTTTIRFTKTPSNVRESYPDLRVYPGEKRDTAYVMKQYKLDGSLTRSNGWVYTRTSLGFMQQCPMLYATDYYLLNPGLDVLLSSSSRNIQFLDSPEPGSKGIKVIEVDSCANTSAFRYLKPEWLAENHLFFDDDYVRIRQEDALDVEIEAEAAFKNIKNSWTSPGKQFQYVRGSPQEISSLFDHLSADMALDLEKENDVLYVRDIKYRNWIRLGAVASCDRGIYPVTYERVPAYVCESGVKGSDLNNMTLRIYEKVH